MLWVGKKFYELAHEYDKNRWLFGVLGVVSYYAGFLVGSFILGIVLEITWPGYVETADERVLALMSVPFGVLGCWGTYKLLERSWSRSSEQVNSQTLDGDLLEK